MRIKLREIGAYMIMGKNTLMKAALNDMKTDNPNIEKIITQLKGNTNLIFTNGDPADVKAILDSEVRGSPAKVGQIAPKDVFVPAGRTGLDPKQTGFFQNLQIQTKICKNQIDIVSEKQVICKGDKVDRSQAELLDKLKIQPFEYKMMINNILQDGEFVDPKILDITAESILAKFQMAINIQTHIAKEVGIPVVSSVPHSILSGFQNLVAVAAFSGFEFAHATALFDAQKKTTAEVEPKVDAQVDNVVVEEVVDVGPMNLFDSDDEY